MTLPLVLLHGWNTNSACWRPLQQLAAERELLPVDFPGHGQRRNEPCPDTLDQLAEDALDRAPAQALWCGWSLGSMLAMRAAIRAPDRIKGLILISPTPRFINGDGWDRGVDRSLLEQFSNAIAEDPVAGLKRFTLLVFESCSDVRRRSRHFYQQLQAGGSANPQALEAGLHILAATDLRAQIREIGQPVRLLTGRHDRICPATAAHWLAETALWPLTEVDDGHAPMLEQADLILQMADQLEAELCHV